MPPDAGDPIIYIIEIIGVPKGIRTPVAAVKVGQRGHFATSVDSRGRIYIIDK
jgi:hypothetical protein